MPDGPLAYRQAIQRRGMAAAVAPATLMGGVSLLLLAGSTSTARGVVGFALAVAGAPVLLIAGTPLEHGTGVVLLCILSSGVLWAAIGRVAARRATGVPAATWRDFWREYLWLAVPVWLGSVAAGVVASVVIGSSIV